MTDLLVAHGYTVAGVTLPQPGKWHAEDASFEDIVGVIRKAIQAELEIGNDVLVVVHSSGGLTGTAAVEGLAKKPDSDRAGVVGIFAIAAILGPAGQNLIDICKGGCCSWNKIEVCLVARCS